MLPFTFIFYNRNFDGHYAIISTMHTFSHYLFITLHILINKASTSHRSFILIYYRERDFCRIASFVSYFIK